MKIDMDYNGNEWEWWHGREREKGDQGVNVIKIYENVTGNP